MDGSMSLILFLGLILLVIIVDGRNFRREGVLLLRRTQKGVPFINRLAAKRAWLFKAFGNIGTVVALGAIGLWLVISRMLETGRQRAAFLAVVIFVAFISVLHTPIITSLLGISGAALFFLLSVDYGILAGTVEESGLQLVLPISIKSTSVLYVPLHYWLFSIFILVLVHEFGHALVSKSEGIPVKSLGYGFLGPIPLGFAEPDEACLKKAASAKQLRVYSAGSLANFLTALVALVIISLLFAPAGVIYGGLVPNMPSEVLPESGIITQLDNHTIKTRQEFTEAVEILVPNQTIMLTVNDENHTLTTTTSPYNESDAFIGIQFPVVRSVHYDVKENISAALGNKPTRLLSASYLYLFWLSLLNIGIGIFNLLPLRPLDGGLMAEQLLREAGLRRWRTWSVMLSLVTLALVLVALFGA